MRIRARSHAEERCARGASGLPVGCVFGGNGARGLGAQLEEPVDDRVGGEICPDPVLLCEPLQLLPPEHQHLGAGRRESREIIAHV